MNLDGCHEFGFDLSTQDGRYVRVKCSQCEAMVINRVPCHEHGCPNKPRSEPTEDNDDGPWSGGFADNH